MCVSKPRSLFLSLHLTRSPRSCLFSLFLFKLLLPFFLSLSPSLPCSFVLLFSHFTRRRSICGQRGSQAHACSQCAQVSIDTFCWRVSLSPSLSRHSPLASIAMPSWSHRGFSSREESSGRLSLSLSPFNGIVSSFSLSFSLYSPPPPPPSISPIHIDNCHVCVYMIGEKNRNKFSKASFPVPSVGSVFVRLVVFVGLRTSSLTVCRCG